MQQIMSNFPFVLMYQGKILDSYRTRNIANQRRDMYKVSNDMTIVNKPYELQCFNAGELQGYYYLVITDNEILISVTGCTCQNHVEKYVISLGVNPSKIMFMDNQKVNIDRVPKKYHKILSKYQF